MTAGPRQATRGGTVALAIAAVITGCGGSDGAGRGDDSATGRPLASSRAADATAPATQPAPQPGVLRSIEAWAGAPDAGGAGHRDGKGSAARFTRPTAVAAASDGSYWVVEAESTRVRRVDADGSVTTLFDARTDRLGFDVDGRQVLLAYPHALAAAPSGPIFGAMQEVRLNPDGSLAEDRTLAVVRVAPGEPPRLVVPPDPALALSHATALALDKQGRLYIAAGCDIWRTDGNAVAEARPGQLQRVHTTAASGCESYQQRIHALAIDAHGHAVFISDEKVLRLEDDLRVTTLGLIYAEFAGARRSAAGPSGGPPQICGGMVVDRHGSILFNGVRSVNRLDASGRARLVSGHTRYGGWQDGSVETARFGSVCGMAIDSQGRVVVADHDNHNLRRGEADGRVITLAGLARQEGYRDGIGQDALFGSYFRVSAGRGDEVLVGDIVNATLRSVDSKRRVSTLVGRPPPEGSPRPFGHPVDGPVATATLDLGDTASWTPDGSLWISDRFLLRRLGPDGIVRTVRTWEMTSVVGRNGELIWDMGLDPDGNLVVGWGHFTTGPAGPYTPFLRFERYSGRAPDAAPELLNAQVPDELGRHVTDFSRGLCVLPDRSIAFTLGHAVLRRAADGTVGLLAGSIDEGGQADGPAASARFSRPGGLACDSRGGLYVADTDNHTVRYIDAQRHVRTVLGSAGQRGHAEDQLPGLLDSPSSLALVPGGLVVATGLGLVRAGF
jgi:hypothetical protein